MIFTFNTNFNVKIVYYFLKCKEREAIIMANVLQDEILENMNKAQEAMYGDGGNAVVVENKPVDHSKLCDTDACPIELGKYRMRVNRNLNGGQNLGTSVDFVDENGVTVDKFVLTEITDADTLAANVGKYYLISPERNKVAIINAEDEWLIGAKLEIRQEGTPVRVIVGRDIWEGTNRNIPPYPGTGPTGGYRPISVDVKAPNPDDDGVVKYTVTVVADAARGSVSPATVDPVEAGANVVFTITPVATYELVSVSVNGVADESVKGETTYTLTDVQMNTEVMFVFDSIPE
jgi:hypothetical protein